MVVNYLGLLLKNFYVKKKKNTIPTAFIHTLVKTCKSFNGFLLCLNLGKDRNMLQ